VELKNATLGTKTNFLSNSVKLSIFFGFRKISPLFSDTSGYVIFNSIKYFQISINFFHRNMNTINKLVKQVRFATLNTKKSMLKILNWHGP
jgi:hypothetical protein